MSCGESAGTADVTSIEEEIYTAEAGSLCMVLVLLEQSLGGYFISV